MKKILFLLLTLALVLGCVTTRDYEKVSLSAHLPKHDVIGLRDGYIQLRSGNIIRFRKAVFTCNTKMIRIESEVVHQTILWINVKKVYIKN